VLKDCIFDRVLAYSVTQLLDFLLTRYELFVERCLLDFAHGCYRGLFKQMLPTASEIQKREEEKRNRFNYGLEKKHS